MNTDAPRVDVNALNEQCVRWGVTPDFASTEKSAHALLAKLPCDSPAGTVHLDWITISHWDAYIGMCKETDGSFEHCVTWLAQELTAAVKP